MSMKILSWNIQWGRGCDGVVSIPRIASVISDMDEFDVICLQEVAINHPGLPGSKGEDEVDQLMAEFPGYSAHLGIGSDLLGENNTRRLFGNLILSRLPVMQVFRHSLPFPADYGNQGMPRIALEVIIAVGDRLLRVTTTHLEYYSVEQRTAQISQLRTIHGEALSQASNRNNTSDLDPPFWAPVRPISSVYCGDFNCEPSAPELAILMKPYESFESCLTDAWLIANPGMPHAFTVGLKGCAWPDRAYCCDYFFISQNLCDSVKRVSVNQGTDASDHQPVLLELTTLPS